MTPTGGPLRVAELCAGYGGLGLALVAAGWPVDLAWYAENDPDASTVMAHHHPGVPNLGDITSADWGRCEPVDILTAGWPCQPFSHAGRQKGYADVRAIWGSVADAVRVLRPRLFYGENVPGLLARGQLGRVVTELAGIGYVGSWTCVRASDLGAAHRRDRLFILAHPADTDRDTLRSQLVQVGTRHSAAVAGDDREGTVGLSLMPTPAARLGARWGQPNAQTAARRMNVEGRRNLDDAVALLPTPAARDSSRGAGWGDQEGRPLSETIMRLLPPPRATDAVKGGPNQRGSSGDLMLPSAVQESVRRETGDPRAYPRRLDAHEDLRDLLPAVHPETIQRPTGGSNPVPEPTQLLTSLWEHPRGSNEECPSLACPEVSEADVRDVRHSDGPARTPQGSQPREQRPLELVDALFELSSHAALAGGSAAAAGRFEYARAHNVQVAWGHYEAAIRRWETIQGRPAPDPTELGRRGGPRLSARFVEFLMGLPDGYVTNHLPRNAALRVLGNGVVPLQGAAAYTALLGSL